MQAFKRQTKETDKMVKIDTLFQTEKCETRLVTETACLSTHAAGPEREQRQLPFAARFWQKKSNPDRVPESEWQKAYPVPDRNALICRPCSRLREAKTIPCWAAHPRIVHIWESPPPPTPHRGATLPLIADVILTIPTAICRANESKSFWLSSLTSSASSTSKAFSSAKCSNQKLASSDYAVRQSPDQDWQNVGSRRFLTLSLSRVIKFKFLL